MSFNVESLLGGIPLDPLPAKSTAGRDTTVPHAPNRALPLDANEKKQALKNALRYFPAELHSTLVTEFAAELRNYGHIYMYRFRPAFDLKAISINEIPTKNSQAAAIILMILNNLDPLVAQFPHELVTYGGNGQVFSNWAQFYLVLHYLATMNGEQTLVLYSGHPLGLFPSHADAPRVVITNGMMIPNFSTKPLYDKYFALGVTMYGQMTAGSYCYIGPQGIVHGTTITLMNAGRKYLGVESLAGKVLVTSGLGGMSGAQAKAAVIAGCIGVIAEVCPVALKKRQDQGWLVTSTDSLDDLIIKIKDAKAAKQPISIGYLGNIVDLWERLAEEWQRTGELLVELGSDQTSLHNPYNGGYYPVQLSMQQSNKLMVEQPDTFQRLVRESLTRQICAIDKLAAAGMRFWDYGNAFLLECHRAGANVMDAGQEGSTRFKYPSYVQDIMGDIFSMGFGPFRWVCTSCSASDLEATDRIAIETFKEIIKKGVLPSTERQYSDNMKWIAEAQTHKLVVGSQARILYSDQQGRVALALNFNAAVKSGKIKAPVVISRDHHDVSGTDSPYRETSNIYDGSAFTADMAVQNFVGDSFRGATWVSLHNGGGVGWGDVINGGFGMVLDGSEDATRRAERMLNWDVSNGVARRCWSGNQLARETIQQTMNRVKGLTVTLPNDIEDENILNVDV